MKGIFIIVACTIAMTLNAQNYKIGVFGGPNLSFLSVKSDYSYSWSDLYKPGIGFDIGVLGSLKVSEKISFDQTIAFQFVTHKDNNVISLRVEDGYNFYNIYKHTINNAYVAVSPQLSYHINEKIYLASGLNINFKVYSQSVFKGSEDYFYKEFNRMKNTYYKTVNAGIPILMGYNYKKLFFRVRFDIGIVNLMKDSNSYFSEKENTLTLNVGYFFH